MGMYEVFKNSKMTPYEFVKLIIKKNIKIYFSKKDYDFASFLEHAFNIILKNNNDTGLKLERREDDPNNLSLYLLLGIEDDQYNFKGTIISWYSLALLFDLMQSSEYYSIFEEDLNSYKEDISLERINTKVTALNNKLNKLDSKLDELMNLFFVDKMTEYEDKETRKSCFSLFKK